MSTATTDPMMTRITEAVTESCSGDTDSARTTLIALWSEIGPSGDPLHRCTLAHYLADLYEHPAEALAWDVRALDAADALTDDRLTAYYADLRVAGFYPSLHLNLADNLRRLGAFPAATRHLDAARARVDALADDPYGTMIRRALDEVAEAVAAGDTTARPTP
ncbi:hypothetical protein [Nocardia sp. AG03]|uniref:hypothetical protein n=1 Tax=Nocardia sp. AG03 TaxID=3025312 RepID=UPI002418493D|nr:hypothetical protein [Nocardia sp. AG03]